MKKTGWTVLKCILFLLLFPAASIAGLLCSVFTDAGFFGWVLAVALVPAVYLIFQKKLVPVLIPINGILAGSLILAITVLMIIGKGNVDGSVLVTGTTVISCFFPGFLIMQMMRNGRELALLAPVLMTGIAFLLSVILQKRFFAFKKAAPFLAAAAVLIGISIGFYCNRPSVRYAGHGFAFMNGYSSTDFSEYTVYSSPTKLVTPDSPVTLSIEGRENMPKMDGAEACYPVYAAAAKAVYRDIAWIEKTHADANDDFMQSNGEIVRFTNTVRGFRDLIEKNEDGTYNVDLFFGARPSKSQLESAQELNTELTITPIGREAFVFFVEPDNPVTNLTSEEIRKIYHGDLTNWAEVGGKDQTILPFQRPKNSGSQAMMEYFMGDVTLREPETYEYVDSMAGVVNQVAQYANDAGALGYSFRYFVEDLNQEKDVRVIAVDGVLPTVENIKNGTYPLTVPLCLVTRTNDPNPNVAKMVAFMLSDAGQEIIEKTGYAGVK